MGAIRAHIVESADHPDDDDDAHDELDDAADEEHHARLCVVGLGLKG